jgi:hypothetical protein
LRHRRREGADGGAEYVERFRRPARHGGSFTVCFGKRFGFGEAERLTEAEAETGRRTSPLLDSAARREAAHRHAVCDLG